MGVMYHAGHYAPQDYVQAAKWFRLAAEEGDADSQYQLGLSYLLGNGVVQDDKQHSIWIQKAAAQGHEEARKTLKILLKSGLCQHCFDGVLKGLFSKKCTSCGKSPSDPISIPASETPVQEKKARVLTEQEWKDIIERHTMGLQQRLYQMPAEGALRTLQNLMKTIEEETGYGNEEVVKKYQKYGMGSDKDKNVRKLTMQEWKEVINRHMKGINELPKEQRKQAIRIALENIHKETDVEWKNVENMCNALADDDVKPMNNNVFIRKPLT